MDLAKGATMRLGLGLGHDAKGTQGHVAGAVGHRERGEQRLDFGQMAMFVVVRMAFVVVAVLPVVVVVFGQADVEVPAGQAVHRLGGEGVGQPFGGEGRERGVKRRTVGAERHQRGHGHVAADAAGTVQIEHLIHGKPFVAPSAASGRPSRPRRNRYRCSPRPTPRRRH